MFACACSYDNEYDEETLAHNIARLSLCTLLETQELSLEFCMKYILDEKCAYAKDQEDAYLDLFDCCRSQDLETKDFANGYKRRSHEEAHPGHAARLVVGARVIWVTGADDDIPAGTCGEIVELLHDSRRNWKVRFPGGTWDFEPYHLALHDTAASELELLRATDQRPWWD